MFDLAQSSAVRSFSHGFQINVFNRTIISVSDILSKPLFSSIVAGITAIGQTPKFDSLCVSRASPKRRVNSGFAWRRIFPICHRLRYMSPISSAREVKAVCIDEYEDRTPLACRLFRSCERVFSSLSLPGVTLTYVRLVVGFRGWEQILHFPFSRYSSAGIQSRCRWQ